MAIQGFKVGSYYRWNGAVPAVKQAIENYSLMARMLDGRPRKCIETDGKVAAEFEGIEGRRWHWYDVSCFDLVPVTNEIAEPYPGYFDQICKAGGTL